MTDDATQNQDANAGGKEAGATPTSSDFKPITSQEDLNKIIGERVKRVESKFADYDVLKAAAAELQQIKDAQKTDDEKTAERLAELEARAEKAEATAIRARIQASHGITNEDAELFLTASDEAALEAQAKAVAELRRNASHGRAPVIPQIGGPVDSQLSAEQQFAAIAGQMFRQ